MIKCIVQRMSVLMILILMVIVGVNTKVFAESDYTCELKMIPNKETIKPGEQIELEVYVSNIQAGNGIVIYNAILEYDEDIFEKNFSVKTEDEWNCTKIENSITFTTSNLEGTIADQTIASIVLTAKQETKVGEYTVTLSKNEFSADDNTQFTIDDVPFTIKVANEGDTEPDNPDNPDSPDNPDNPNNPSQPEQPNNPSGSNGNGNSSNGNGSSTSGSTQKPANSGNQATTKLPYAGNVSFLVLAIFVGVTVTIIFYIKYKKAYEE